MKLLIYSWLIDVAVIVKEWCFTLSTTDLAILAGILILHRIVAMMGMWPYAIFTLAGTCCHEYMHWQIAKILCAHPKFPSLIPEKIEGGWRLGSVSFTPSLWKNIPIALAPFLLAPFGLWWAVTYMHSATGWWYLIHAWIAGTVIMASSPSSQDWKIAASALCVLFAIVGYFALSK